MKHILIFLFFNLLLHQVPLFAQEKEWKTETMDDGITVKYRISERLDDSGKKVPLIEDITTTVVSGITLEKCIVLMKDISKHKEFTGDYRSELVTTVSDNEWIVYYYTKNPWPIANSDCVSRMILTKEQQGKVVIFDFTAAPTKFKKGDVARMSYCNIRYTFKEMGNGKVEITMSGKTSPPVSVPGWIIESAFPGVPAKAMTKLTQLLKG